MGTIIKNMMDMIEIYKKIVVMYINKIEIQIIMRIDERNKIEVK